MLVTWEQWTFSLGAVPVSLIVLRNVLWRFGCTNSGSKTLLAFGLGSCLLCITLAVIWQVHTANAAIPSRDDRRSGLLAGFFDCVEAG
ncbi:hypothetical protein C1I64_07560 [Rathayibacter festucae DSM 15932]|uniref:Uncharacterized protein n=1 Tax=Rathayibacter festucae DSM 15932 TaxID=1328866 RepID=A0A3T0T020_9MICO|nr:hypothetical protein C1I64_07560 [Rathayibacter festucae DSM 15932]